MLAGRTKGDHINFKEAKRIVIELKIKTCVEYRILKTENHPKLDKLPRRPDLVYKKQWKGWGRFLKNGIISENDRAWLDYENAKKLVKKLGIKSSTQYQKFLKKNNHYRKILPAQPERVYS